MLRHQSSARPLFRFTRWAIAGLTFIALALPVNAAEKYGSSLDWVPADVSFYSSSLRLKEQIDIVAASNAWQKFRSIPSVAMVWQMADAQINNPNGPAAMPLQLMQLPENQQLLQMLGDMFSHEIVVYGGPKVGDCLELFQLVNAAQQKGALKAARAGQDGGEQVKAGQARAILEAIQQHKELLKTPEFVLAFKLVDKQAAETQLKRLEVLSRMALKRSPISDRLKREKVGDAEFLTLNLDGGLIPWDQVPWDDVEEKEGEFAELREALQKMTLVVSLGVRDNYLIFSIDESTENLATLGKGSVLAGVKELSPLAKFRDRKLVSVGYVSQAFAKQVGMDSADIDRIVDQVSSILEVAGVSDDKLKDRIAGDVAKAGDDLKQIIPNPAAIMGFCFLTDTGYEGYTYNWAVNPAIDGTKPLQLTNHLGGNPIFAIVSRAKYDPESYDTLVKWLKVAHSYFEEFAVPKMPPDQQKRITEGWKALKPLVVRADETTRKSLTPSLKDGQSAFVIDAQISSKQWHKDMPSSDHALPMLELALVIGVSDATLFNQAMSEYKAIADDMVETIRERNPGKIPADYKVPSPESETIDGDTVYTYKLPADAGLDPQIAPSGGVGEHVAVFSTSPKLSARILAETPLKSQGSLASAADKPCASVITFSWSSLVEASAPWIEFAVRQKARHGEDEDAEKDSPQVAEVLSQVRTVLDILKCWKATESVTTVENGMTVSHSVTTFKDME